MPLQKRHSSDFDLRRGVQTARPSTGGTSGTARDVAGSQTVRPHQVSPRTRTRDIRSGSPGHGLAATAPSDRGLAAAARMATTNGVCGGDTSSRTRLGTKLGEPERPRRHSALPCPGSPPPPTRQAWRFVGAPSPGNTAADNGGTSPKIALAATDEIFSPVMTPVNAGAKSSGAFSFAPSSRKSLEPVTGVGPSAPSRAAGRLHRASAIGIGAMEDPNGVLDGGHRQTARAQSAIRSRRPSEATRARSVDPGARTDREQQEHGGKPEEALQSPEVPPQAQLVEQAVEVVRCQPSPQIGKATSEQQLHSNIAPALAAVPCLRRSAPFKTLPSELFSGRYNVGKYLGRGASATVWEAVHSDSSLRVAVKVFDQGSRDRRQAHREMRVLSRIQHPNLVEAYEVVEATNFAQLVCEFVDGESLRNFAQRQPCHRLTENLARRFYRQILEGVNHCHDRLIVHRDLKLENLLLDRSQEKIKIIDFGFAAQVANKDAKLRAFCGTPSYMAPEIIRGDGYSGFSADVWALGVVIFALLVGSLPFIGRTEMQLYNKIRRGIFTCPDSLGELPRRLIKGTIRIDPTTRPPASAVLRHAWVGGGPFNGDGDTTPSSGSVCSQVPQLTSKIAGVVAVAGEVEVAISNTPRVGAKTMDAKRGSGLHRWSLEKADFHVRSGAPVPGTAIGGC